MAGDNADCGRGCHVRGALVSVSFFSRGYFYVGMSIILVTLAQLSMKWGMSHLPALDLRALSLVFWIDAKIACLFVFGGVCAYLLSMLCWLQALTIVPLNRAYPLLSMSYVLVYMASISLPWFHEFFSLSQCIGVVLITAGVVAIVSSPAQHLDPASKNAMPKTPG